MTTDHARCNLRIAGLHERIDRLERELEMARRDLDASRREAEALRNDLTGFAAAVDRERAAMPAAYSETTAAESPRSRTTRQGSTTLELEMPDETMADVVAGGLK